MLQEPTFERLRALKLDALAEAWRKQQADPAIGALGFDERLGLLVDAEWIHRENKRLKRTLTEAKLRITGACVEDLDYAAGRALDRAVVRQLATCRWIEERLSVVITGATGTGKTYVACALAQQACRRGFRVLYRRVPRLLEELALARADGSWAKVLARFARVDVLVLDDWGMAPLRESERRDLIEVIEDREGLRSTILASQLPVGRWHDHIGDPTIADALCDRILHRAHRIELKGPSRRKGVDESGGAAAAKP